MAYCYPHITGREIKRGSLTFKAVAEHEINSSFGTLEDCAETTLSVLVSDDSEQVACIDCSVTFWFAGGRDTSGNYWRPDALKVYVDLDNVEIGVKAHGFDQDETTAEDLEPLEAAGGGERAFWNAVEVAAACAARALEGDVRALKLEDTTDCYDVPRYAVAYMVNGDPGDMTAEEIADCDRWVDRITDGSGAVFDPVRPGAVFEPVRPGADPYFSRWPAFGPAADCERISVQYA